MTTHETDRSAEPLIRLPDAPAGLRRRRVTLTTFLKFFGPGAIIASLTIGSGESVLASREGAMFGYAALWTVVLGVVAKGALVYASNRHITLTGEHPMTRFARVFPGPRGWFPALLALICIASFPGWTSGVTVALGDYVETLGGGSSTVWAVVFLLVAAGLSYAGGYALLERLQIGIAALMVVLVLVAVFIAQPDWLGVLGGLVPGAPDYLPFVGERYPDIADASVWVELTVFMGGLGGGMYDYIGYTGLLREKRWGMLGHRDITAIRKRLAEADPKAEMPLTTEQSQVDAARHWSRAPLFDMLSGFIAMAVIAAAFMINGAAILSEQQQVPSEDDMLTHQSAFFGAVAPVFEYFYIVAIFMVMFGTAYAVWEVYSWTAYESLSAVSERIRRRGQRGIRPYVYLWTGTISLVAILSGLDFVALVTPASIVGGVLACGVYGAGLLYVDKVNLPKPYRMSRSLRVLVGFGSVFLTVAGALALVEYVGALS